MKYRGASLHTECLLPRETIRFVLPSRSALRFTVFIRNKVVLSTTLFLEHTADEALNNRVFGLFISSTLVRFRLSKEEKTPI